MPLAILQEQTNYRNYTMKFKKPRLDRENAWMQVIESAVLFIAAHLNPDAVEALFCLKLCFEILDVLRHHHRK
jgi:hypothetical protein